MARLFCQLHAFIDGGVGGNAVEKPELKDAEAESDQNFRIELGIGTLEQRANLPIEPDLPAKHAQHQSRGQIAVRGRECTDLIGPQQDRRHALCRVRQPEECGRRLCARERWQAWRSTQPRICRERISAQELGGIQSLLAFELHFQQLEPCVTGAADEQTMILDAH